MAIVASFALVACEDPSVPLPTLNDADREALVASVNSPLRPDTEKERDKYRHPVETLDFFAIKPDHNVVELWPGGGWYTRVLVSYLGEKGKLYLAHFPAETSVGGFLRAREAMERTIRSNPLYRNVVLTQLGEGLSDIAPAGSVDRVLTFRNLHNWLSAGYMDEVFEAAYRALKPGGYLGVVEHRALHGTLLSEQIESGYVTEIEALRAARNAGFELMATSDINNNSKDTKGHPKGVWTLPPSLRLGDVDKDIYLSIGESDRMTLLFKKPE